MSRRKESKAEEESSGDSRFDELDAEETGAPVDKYGRPTKFAANYESSSDEEFPDEFKKYENSESEEEITTRESTKRLAVTGLNWKKVKASDIFAFIELSVDKKETLQNITVYLSHYGQEHIDDYKESDLPEDEPDDVRAAAWRHRQHCEAKFYFAVAEFSDEKSADYAYQQLSQCEFGDTGNFLDLSVVPDEVDFADFQVRDTSKSVPEDWEMPNIAAPWMSKTKAEDDWELNPATRIAAVNACWEEGEDDEAIQEVASNFLLGDGSEDEEKIERKDLSATLELLRQAEEEEEDQNEDKSKEIEFEFVSMAGANKKKAKKVNKSDSEQEDEEQEEEKEKAKPKKQEKKKAKKHKPTEQEDSQIVDDIMQDPRFKSVLDNPGYGIDATSSTFKRDPAMDKLASKIASQHQNRHLK